MSDASAVELILYTERGTNPAVTVANIDSVVWRLNRTGVARLFLPYADPLCNPARLAFGNRALIRFGNNLPAFGGVIDVPRIRTEAGVSFWVYSADRILSWRVSDKIASFTSESPGTIAQTLLETANATHDTTISPVLIYDTGEPRTEEYNYSNLLDAFQRLARQSGEDFKVAPRLDGERLVFDLIWTNQMGSDKSEHVAFIQGTNIATPIEVNEQGPIASHVYEAGGGAGGTTWTSRLVGEEENTETMANYGYREYAEVQTGIFDQPTLDAIAAATLDQLDHPRGHMKVEAQDKAPARFDQYIVGDQCRVEAYLDRPGWEYVGRVRVLGRSWTAAGTCRLEVIEW